MLVTKELKRIKLNSRERKLLKARAAGFLAVLVLLVTGS
jgi:hypothetical protein